MKQKKLKVAKKATKRAAKKATKKATKKGGAVTKKEAAPVSLNQSGPVVRVNLSLPRDLFLALRKKALQGDAKGLVGKYITRQLHLDAGAWVPVGKASPAKKRPEVGRNSVQAAMESDEKAVAIAVAKGGKALFL